MTRRRRPLLPEEWALRQRKQMSTGRGQAAARPVTVSATRARTARPATSAASGASRREARLFAAGASWFLASGIEAGGTEDELEWGGISEDGLDVTASALNNVVTVPTDGIYTATLKFDVSGLAAGDAVAIRLNVSPSGGFGAETCGFQSLHADWPDDLAECSAVVPGIFMSAGGAFALDGATVFSAAATGSWLMTLIIRQIA